MLSPRWYKVIRDLWLYKTRTALVVLSIAVGVFAFGAIAMTQENILRELRDSYVAVNPASATLTTSQLFDEDLVDAVRRIPGISAAEGHRTVDARILVGPDDWYDLSLFVIPDDGQMSVNIVRPEAGAWPPPDKAMLLERSSRAIIPFAINDTVTVEIAGGEQRTLPIAGLTHDLSRPPAMIAGAGYGYITLDTLEWFGATRAYNEMQIVVAEHPLDEQHIWHIATQAEDQIERSGREVEVIDVPSPPQQHPAEVILPTMLTLLSALGMFALILGMFLIITIIEAILTQQIRHIGMMKAIGARDQDIMVLYFSMLFIIGGLALVLAVPLGTLAGRGFLQFLAAQLNVDVSSFNVPLNVLAIQAGAALLLPILTAFPSIRSTVRITVREAISTTGGGASRRAGSLIERITQSIPGLSRPLVLSLRNTFRRKGRLARTLLVLTLAGVIFISVLTIRSSLFRTLADTVATKQYDVEIQFARTYRDEFVAPLIKAVPGVVDTEGWRRTIAFPVRPNGSEGEEITLYAVPPTTELLDLPVEQGRWLLPEDERAIVVTSNFLNKEPDTQLGDELVLQIGGEEHRWRIVGFSEEFIAPVNPATGYVSYDGLVRAVGGVGHVDSLQVVTERQDAAFLAQMTQMLEEYTAQHNLDIRLITTSYEDQMQMQERFNLITALLGLMAALIGFVGGLGLMGTMSINVLERTKEIGIMRAVGASDGQVQQIVIAEGLVIGCIAWILGIVLSVPVSQVMSTQMGIQLLSQPLTFTYEFFGVVLWLAIVLVLATIASYLPARSASQVTVREVLTHE
jgi:putative ABC transport system permease protein